MSTRSRNDISGAKSRMQNALTKWREHLNAVQEHWNDGTAQAFYQSNLVEAEPLMSRLITSLQEASDLVRTLERKVADTDYD